MRKIKAFDVHESTRRRDCGMKRVKTNNPVYSAHLRSIAIRLARKHGSVDADSLHKEVIRLKKLGKFPDIEPTSYNVYGPVFRDPRLKKTGRYDMSSRPARHRGVIWYYRLAE